MSTLHKDHRDILIAPVVSEKSYGLLDANKYTFIVRPDANKTEIKIAVEKVFNVKVTSVNTINRQGKTRRTRTGLGKRANTKRAIVSLAEGHRIDIFGQVRSPDRRNRTDTHGYPQVQADHPGPSRLLGGRLRRDHPDHAGEVADASAAQEGRPQQPGPDHHPAPGWRSQARLPHHRLPSLRQGRRARQGRSHRVRPQPHRAHRAAALRRRREALHHRAEGPVAGHAVESGANADIKPGNNLPLRNIPVGTTIHCVELRPGGGAKIARSAGNSAQLVAREGSRATLRMPSGEMRFVDVRCRATVGEVGNAEQSNINWGKAGRMRWKGKRPTVRGVVMNPVDHPHGGGEGKTSGGRHPVSPWGQPEGRTRKRKASDSQIIRRRKSGKGRK